MSEAEFSAYLSLLSRLLKISPAQRAEIQDELRDHLELRLKELIAAGHPREAAVGMALADLGDAHGLAREFQSLAFRKQRRRWLRWTMATLAGTAALVLAVINLFPFQPAETLNPRFMVMAQADGPVPQPANPPAAGAVGSSPFVQTSLPVVVTSQVRIERPVVAVLPETEAHQLIEHKLGHEFVCEDVTIQQALEALEKLSGVEIYIDPSVEGAGYPSEVMVTLKVNRSGNLNCRNVLTLLLREWDRGLSYAIRDNLVVILPLEDTADLRIYDCRDFLPASCLAAGEAAGTMPYFTFQKYSGAAMGGQSSSGASGVAPGIPVGPLVGPGGGTGTPVIHTPSQTGLVELLRTSVQSGTWSEDGGLMTIYEYRGLLIVKQSPEAHVEITNLIKQLRFLAGVNGGADLGTIPSLVVNPQGSIVPTPPKIPVDPVIPDPVGPVEAASPIPQVQPVAPQ